MALGFQHHATLFPRVAPSRVARDDKMWVGDLINMVRGTDLGSDVTESKRVMVNELLVKLERTNPTQSPATSPLLNGEWDLVYAGGRGPGLLAFPPLLAGAAAAARAPDGLVQLRRTKVAISRTQPRVLASGEAALLGGLGPFAPQLAVALAVESTLEAESDLRLKETYFSVAVGGSKAVEVPKQAAFSRLLFVTYLDDDLLVARDECGAPEILLRREKDFPEAEGTPSASDDDVAPGAG